MNNTQPKFVGKYQIVKQISRTPQALTFLSKSPVTNAPAVIKLYPNKLAQTQGFMKQFLSEMSHINELEHPNILCINHYELTDKFPSIDMPYMAGGNLETRIQANANSAHFKDAINQIFPALIYAHRQGIIHGNIKPTNILFDQKGNAYLSDFGLDSVVQYHEGYTHSVYASPEQIHSQGLDERSDVFSFGMVLFAWITGITPPHAAVSHSEYEYEPMSLRRSIPTISVAMDEVIQRATEYDPSKRYGSIKSFSQAFFDALRTDKLFLGMVSSVKSDVTEFESRDLQANTVEAGKEPVEKIKTTEPRKWYDIFLGLIPIIILVVVIRFGLLYLSNFSSSPSYQPAYNPPGFVLVSGRSVEISAPAGWTNLLVSSEDRALGGVFGEVNVDLGIISDVVDSLTKEPQIMVQNPSGGGTLSITVILYGGMPLDDMKETLKAQLQSSQHIVNNVQIVLLPAGQAVLVTSIRYGRTHTYAFLYNGKMYLLEFTGTASDYATTIMETFRIKS
jgi:serine/threonine protein kinase